jgi:hypothetical protein
VQHDASMNQSLCTTLPGVVAGAFLGGCMLLLAGPLHLNQDSRVMGALLYLAPSLFALIGFNQARHTLPPPDSQKVV